jgi:hypothetical protein
MSIGAVEHMACRWLVLLLAPEISGREDAVINRARFSNEANSLALRFWDKSNDFTHDHRSIKLRSSFHGSIWVFDATFEVLQSVTTEQKLVTGANVGNQLFPGSMVQLSRDCCSWSGTSGHKEEHTTPCAMFLFNEKRLYCLWTMKGHRYGGVGGRTGPGELPT